MRQAGRLPAYTVYLASRFAFNVAFMLFATVSGVYRVQDAQLNALQLILVGTALELSVFLFEAPTGIVADLYSRRLSTIIGMFIVGIGFILEGSFVLFGTILLAQVVWGIGYTFTSGATDAWIADELGEAGLVRVYLRGSQVATLGSLLGIVGGMAIGSVQVSWGMLAGGAVFILLGLFLLLVMPETNFRPAPREHLTTFQAMGSTFRGGVAAIRGRPTLITLMIIGAIYGASSEAFDRLREAHLIRSYDFPAFDDKPVLWFGAIGIAGMFLSLVVTEVIRRRISANSPGQAARALLIVNTLLMAGVIGFGVAGNVELAITTYLVAFLMRQLNVPLYTALVNQSINPQVRATVLSMTTQADSFGQFTGGPLLGVVGTVFSVRAAIVATGVVLVPAMALYARIARDPGGELPVEPAPDDGSEVV
ncbi:MAG TPA: MFS transporter [Thermomicrobiales bacterium]|nr:MFS transporter [Thermomicrobiales bacterium]